MRVPQLIVFQIKVYMYALMGLQYHRTFLAGHCSRDWQAGLAGGPQRNDCHLIRDEGTESWEVNLIEWIDISLCIDMDG